jgi:hypothetical protein
MDRTPRHLGQAERRCKVTDQMTITLGERVFVVHSYAELLELVERLHAERYPTGCPLMCDTCTKRKAS